jgi:hypothetical protein
MKKRRLKDHHSDEDDEEGEEEDFESSDAENGESDIYEDNPHHHHHLHKKDGVNLDCSEDEIHPSQQQRKPSSKLEDINKVEFLMNRGQEDNSRSFSKVLQSTK